MDETPLERSIKEEAERTIEDIRRKEADEIVRLEERYATDMETLRKEHRAETDRRIAQESSRIEHRKNLDRKKQMLRIVEDFIGVTVVDAVRDIKEDPQYVTFLQHTIHDALDIIPAGAEIRMKKEDLTLGKAIVDALKATGKSGDVIIQEDNSIAWGGCVVRDQKKGCILNGAVARIYFRKSPAIRVEVLNILKKYGLKDEAEGH